MILGLGSDLVAVARIAAVHARRGAAFRDRVYTPDEQAWCLAAADPAERLAARWAAKEAAMKALGRGWGQGVEFTDIAVTRDAWGAPGLLLSGGAARRAAELGVARCHVTLSHSAGLALATVILES
jgi:holo-[acyl-carrier protein] synthase